MQDEIIVLGDCNYPFNPSPAIVLDQQIDTLMSLQALSVTNETRRVSQCTEQSMHTANITTNQQ